MAYSLKHIPEWNALELKYNGKNTTQQNARFLNFMNNIPELYQPDDFTFLIPQKYFDSYYEQFSYSTTMTQTVSSIRGDEKVILPEIDYELKHMDTFKLKPFPFQRVGISFLVSVKAGILGDEMGLGKTPQSLGAMHELLQEKKIKKALIIVPASLKYQWAGEVEKFTDYNSIVVHGTKKQRREQYETFKNSDNIHFIIGGYEAIRNDIELVKELDFECISLDEAHRLKNRKSKTYLAITQLNPEYKFCLTGTPMQNRPEEIFALMNWINKDILGGITKFRKNHVITGEKFGRRFIDLGYKNLDEIRDKISPNMLRRMKKEVAPDLPDMIYSTVRADMNKAQQMLYQAITDDFEALQNELKEFYEMQSEQDAQAGKKSPDESKILGFIYMMQAVSDHPFLLAQGKSKMARKYMPLVRECRTSPKLEELIETLIPLVERGSDIVIFSQYTSMLKIIYDRIEREFNQEAYVIQGDVDAKERQARVEDFKKNPTRQIMLLSDAGNYGLNIENADTLIHYDKNWNPSVIAQRNGRIHRLTSEFKTVDIVSLITNDTIDEQIEQTLQRKTELGEGIVEKNFDEKKIMQDLLDALD